MDYLASLISIPINTDLFFSDEKKPEQKAIITPTKFTLFIQPFVDGLNRIKSQIFDWTCYTIITVVEILSFVTFVVSCIFNSIFNHEEAANQIEEKERIVEIEILDRNSSQPLELEQVKGLFSLTNLNATSCYFDSALQAIFCLKEMRDLLHKELAGENVEKRLQAQQTLIDLLASHHPSRKGTDGLSPQQKAQNAIFQLSRQLVDYQKEHSSGYLTNVFNSFSQDDAATICEIILEQILEQNFFTQKKMIVPDLPGVAFIETDIQTSLRLQFPENLPNLEEHEVFNNQKKVFKLIDFVGNFFKEVKEDNERDFDLRGENVVEIDSDLAQITKDNHIVLKDCSSHQSISYLNQFPDVLPIHLVRFRNDQTKIDSPIELPQDGIIELTDFYLDTSLAQPSIRYELMSYIKHSGSYRSGHYTAFIKLENSFYHCNDIASPPCREITKEEFYANTDAYFLFFRRVNEESINHNEPSVQASTDLVDSSDNENNNNRLKKSNDEDNIALF